MGRDFLMDFWFDKEFYNFSRLNIKDMHPYKIIEEDNRFIIVHNVAGIGKEDVKIDIEDSYLIIKGESKDEIIDKTYSVNSRFKINENAIKDIKYDVKNGFLYVFVNKKEKEKPNIKISIA